MIYRPTFTSVVPDNTICLVVVFADVFVVTPQHSSFFGRGLSFRCLLPSSFLLLSYQYSIRSRNRPSTGSWFPFTHSPLSSVPHIVSRLHYQSLVVPVLYLSSLEVTEARHSQPERELCREGTASELDYFWTQELKPTATFSTSIVAREQLLLSSVSLSYQVGKHIYTVRYHLTFSLTHHASKGTLYLRLHSSPHHTSGLYPPLFNFIAAPHLNNLLLPRMFLDIPSVKSINVDRSLYQN
jgi:hypothetical protein